MGTLDEAIREHLDLKRRGGADPGEVAKLEREAFGPIRREDALSLTPAEPAAEEDPFAAEPGQPVLPEDVALEDPDALAPSSASLFDAHADPAPAADLSKDHPVSVPFDLGADAVAPDAAAPPAAATTPAAEPAPSEPTEGERVRASAAPLPPLDADAPTDPAAIAGEHTVEFSALDHAEATEGEPADELEETPDFLEETPEHDRLWFEQKPPRDFDF